MTSPKPTLVLISGAWHTSTCYDLIIPPLESSGYTTIALTLPSVGAEPALPDFSADVALIHKTVTKLVNDGKEVVVIMHSYGGMPGTEAMKGLGREDRKKNGKVGGVVKLVYLTSWMVSEGQSVLSSGGGRGGKGGESKVRVDGGKIHHLCPIPLFYNDVSQDEAEYRAAQIKHHSRETFNSKLTYPAYKYIPTVYMFCTEDQTIPIERQEKLVPGCERGGDDDRDCEGGGGAFAVFESCR